MNKNKLFGLKAAGMVAALLLTASVLLAGPIHNTTQNLDYTDIQSAINAANSGDQIDVDAGTFDISSGITINKGIQIHGASFGVPGTATARTSETILVDNRAPATNPGAFAITTTDPVIVDGITLQGSKIIVGQPANAQLTFGNNRMILAATPNSGQTGMIFSTGCILKLDKNYIETTGFNASNSALMQVVGAYNGTSSTVDKVLITNNIFKGIPDFTTYNGGNGQSVLQVNLSDCQGSISNNTFDGVDIGVLLANNCGNLSVAGNTFTDIKRDAQDIPLGYYGAGIVLYNPSFTGPINISGNTFQNSDCGIRTSTDGSPFTETGTNLHFSANTFSGNIYDIVNKFSNVTFNLDGDNTLAGTTLSSATAAQLFAVEDKIVHKIDKATYGFVNFKANNVYVTPNSFFMPGGTTTPSIQRGVDASANGYTVHVAAGTFNEIITVNKNITLNGANAGISGLAMTRVTPTNLVSTPTCISLATGNTLTVDGFDFNGRSLIVGGTTNGLSVLNCKIITDAPNGSNCIYVGQPFTTFNVQNNDISMTSNCQATIQPVGNYAGGNSIGNIVNISGNKFTTTVSSPGDGVRPVAVNLANVQGQVTQNQFTGIDIGVLVANGSGNLDISQNVFDGLVRSTTNTGNSSYGAGVVLFALDQSAPAINIHNNEFKNSDVGVRTSATSDFSSHAVNINDNSFTNNQFYHLRNAAGAGTFNATCNWYGTANSAAIATKINGSVIYSPFRSNGTDNSTAIGFQPVSNSCNGNNNAPAITCPANTTINCSASTLPANTGTATATSNCGSIPTITYTDATTPGVNANNYTITRTWTATDACGNTSNCNQTITVQDATAPTVSCPGNQTVNVVANTCAGTYTIMDPLSDNCTGATWGYTLTNATTGNMSGIADGTNGGILSLNKGVTTITLSGTDGVNNATGCSFNVTVADNQAPTLACPGNQSMNTAAGTCAAPYTITDPITDNCTGATWGYTLTGATTATVTSISDGTNSSAISFNKGVTTVTLIGTDGINTAVGCSFTVTVSDNIAPVIACPTNMNVNNDPGTCNAVVNFNLPTATDNCSGGTITGYTQSTETYQAYDMSGATTLGYDDDALYGPVTLPFTFNYYGTNFTNAYPCTNGFLSFQNIGASYTAQSLPNSTYTNTIFSAWSDWISTVTYKMFGTTPNRIAVFQVAGNSFSGGGAINSQIALHETSNTIELINTTVSNTTYNRTEGLNKNGTTATIVSGRNQSQWTTSNEALLFTPGGAITVTQTAGLASGSTFPKGVTTNTFTATDASGNVSTPCSFTVTVTDSQAPVVTCPGNQSLNTAAGTCAANYTIADPITDNCTGATWGYTLSGATSATVVGIADGTNSSAISFNKGLTTVTLNGTDGANTATTCSFTVTVADNQAPVVACPNNQTMNVVANTCAANYAIVDPISDNCTSSTWGYSLSGVTAGSATGITDGTSSGAVSFNKGVTTVTLSGTDGTNTATTCSFTVTVNDNQAPTITAPPTVTVNGYCQPAPASAVNLGSPTVGDNCASQSTLTANTTNNAPATYPVGSTLVTWTVTDGNGNSATSNQTVTVNPGVVTATTAVSPLYPMTGQEIQTIYLNYPSSAQSETITTTASGGTGPGTYTYSWKTSGCNNMTMVPLNGVTGSSYTFSPTAATVCAGNNDNIYIIIATITDSHGCSTTQTKKLNVVDPYVSGGNVQICHKVAVRGGTTTQLLTVTPSQVAAHLAHGDGLGNCPVFNGTKMIEAEAFEEQTVIVYPNPTTGVFILELSEIREGANIMITDVQGKVVALKSISKDEAPTATFDLNNYAKGIYLIQVRDGELNYRTKIVVQ